MKTFVSWTIILFLGIIFQASFFSGLLGVAFKPDLMLVIVVSSGLLFGKETGLGIGFFAGALLDLASGNIFGLNTLSKMAVGYVAGLLESKVFKENFFLPVLAAVLATVLSYAIIFLFLNITGYHLPLWPFFKNHIFWTATYNLIIAFPVHRLIYKIFSWSRAS